VNLKVGVATAKNISELGESSRVLLLSSSVISADGFWAEGELGEGDFLGFSDIHNLLDNEESKLEVIVVA
jgi:hypothetical protein